ncbi:ergothioneine biosynthesis protein EgtB [Dyadobacter tibetensis]|uniref:ergothioneine biosynthesis protein EgtB n=1 Tax=Dyadobacter tibetensis TaxID=1211851 RepID=UPI0004721DC3|nr:ergothioneine biosynthesis protein EgtB [Dyadobacter tibetensis]
MEISSSIPFSKSAELLPRYEKIRKQSEEICAPLQVEDYVPQPVPFISPAKWHLAHTTWFFETFILSQFLPGYVIYEDDFSFLFNSYYNNVGNRLFRAHRGNITRPGIAEVYAYRNYVDNHMRELLLTMSSDKVEELLLLGLNHEQQHQELMLTDLKYILGHNPTFPVYDKTLSMHPNEGTLQKFLSIPEGVYEIGHAGNGFCFDNELGRHKTYIHDFEIADRLVTNGEYLEFMKAGGYSDFNCWLDEGWTWVESEKVNSPMYWHEIDGIWYHYTLSGLQMVDPAAILTHVNFYEASAYAQWKGLRLPTEFEWEVASEKLNWGQRWEWTNSAYLPYPKFQKADGAVGEYNGKFMVNQMVLRGASVATSEGHSRPTYRNFFHPQYRWQYTGIRLAR